MKFDFYMASFLLLVIFRKMRPTKKEKINSTFVCKLESKLLGIEIFDIYRQIIRECLKRDMVEYYWSYLEKCSTKKEKNKLHRLYVN